MFEIKTYDMCIAKWKMLALKWSFKKQKVTYLNTNDMGIIVYVL
jgi:hypothetical protein